MGAYPKDKRVKVRVVNELVEERTRDRRTRKKCEEKCHKTHSTTECIKIFLPIIKMRHKSEAGEENQHAKVRLEYLYIHTYVRRRDVRCIFL